MKNIVEGLNVLLANFIKSDKSPEQISKEISDAPYKDRMEDYEKKKKEYYLYPLNDINNEIKISNDYLDFLEEVKSSSKKIKTDRDLYHELTIYFRHINRYLIYCKNLKNEIENLIKEVDESIKKHIFKHKFKNIEFKKMKFPDKDKIIKKYGVLESFIKNSDLDDKPISSYYQKDWKNI